MNPNVVHIILVVVIAAVAVPLFGLGPLEAAAFTFFASQVLGYCGI